MKRKIININEELCNGCGACADACHEGAIGMIDGKAKLLRDDYCDGLGDCLPVCPVNAISFEVREAAAYDEKAVMANSAQKMPCGCPGTLAKTIQRQNTSPEVSDTASKADAGQSADSQLQQWPVQIKLAPVNAPYFNGARLLIAADCTAYAYAGFHEKFIKDHITLIGCPKLDSIDYSEKLAEIIRTNEIKSISVVRMEVPCCGGIENAVKTALINSGKMIPWSITVISTDGKIIA